MEANLSKHLEVVAVPTKKTYKKCILSPISQVEVGTAPLFGRYTYFSEENLMGWEDRHVSIVGG